ncbi:MAG: class I SAM-dependent methyltransferase [Pirellulales bacterium]|nr:class I SAM-dependent methyltransferase [Pirellulales bacterium]
MSKTFEFGENWARFLDALDEEQIERARRSLQEMLGVESLRGKNFLDAGSGSGLFSLAARRLGAAVRSFDRDPQSVACAHRLKALYSHDDHNWTVEDGSVLDVDYLRRLGQFDVVYCWGVLHHTGKMWSALANLFPSVADGGLLFVAVYNDQGLASRVWRRIKKLYNQTPKPLRPLLLLPCAARLWGPTMIRDLLRLKPFHTWRNYRRDRGMSPWRDLLDWVGGYPFEVARPERVVDFCRKAGLELLRQKTCGGGRGCNEFVFQRRSTRHET